MDYSIVDTFNKYFEMVPADTAELRNEVYRLRYQVYCVENDFLDPSHYDNAMESDEFDEHSAHYLIRHRKLGVFMATTRLVLPEASNVDKLFPIEIHSEIDNFDAIKDVARHYLAEASRFCVSKEFRGRKNEASAAHDSDTLENTFTEDEKKIFPHITLALFACLIKMSHEHNVKDWYAVMEPALIRFFSTLGVKFVGIGPVTEYHGKRKPCVINVDDLLNGVASRDTNRWDMLTNKGKFWKEDTDDAGVSMQI